MFSKTSAQTPYQPNGGPYACEPAKGASLTTSVNRRTALSFAWGVAACAAFSTWPVLAQVAPRRREPLWGTLELNLGLSTKLVPQAETLNLPVESKPGYGSELLWWRALVARARNLGPERQLQMVHLAIQKTPYRPDGGFGGEADYWTHPLEFLQRGGDCEDYAVAKFKMLEAAGFPTTDMRIAIVRNAITAQFHAVLVAYIDGQASILDSQSPVVYQQARQTAFDPICSLDRKSLWLHWNGSDLNRRVALLRERLNRLA